MKQEGVKVVLHVDQVKNPFNLLRIRKYLCRTELYLTQSLCYIGRNKCTNGNPKHNVRHDDPYSDFF